jgi:hypothetical protein
LDMSKIIGNGAAALAVAAVIGFGWAAPGVASPLPTGVINVNAGSFSVLTDVRWRGGRGYGGWGRRAGVGFAAGAVIGGALAAPYAYGYGPAYGYDYAPAYGFGGAPYGYLSSNGRVYSSCVFDEGYGRVRPCDAGND